MNDYCTFIIFPITTSAIAYWGTSFLWFILDFAIAPEYRVNKYPIDWILYKQIPAWVVIGLIILWIIL